jgi:hypothetical protein
MALGASNQRGGWAAPPGASGPDWPAGPVGPAGPKGASATGLWASVDSNGTLIRGQGVTSAEQIGSNAYQVVFDRNVTGCGYVATVGDSGGAISAAAIAEAHQRLNVVKGVEVDIYSSTGGGTIRPFYVAVFC